MLDRVSTLNLPRRPLRCVDLDSPLVRPPPPSSSPPRLLSEMEMKEEDVVLDGSARMEMARAQKGDGDDGTFYSRLSSAVTSLYRPIPRDEHADARQSSSSSWEEGPVGDQRGEWVELRLSAEAAAHSKKHNSIWVRSTLAFEMYTEEGEAEGNPNPKPNPNPKTKPNL
jgi:hypothetical protein